MESLIFALEAVMPIVLTVAIGYFLKKLKFMSADFSKAANKLVFRVFLPSMLFLNIYKIESLSDMEAGYIIYVIAALAAIFFLALPCILWVTKKPERRGALLQASFRSNYALIGILLASSLFGSAGVAVATLLSAVTIPMLNILAVISLSIFRRDGGKVSIRSILMGIIKNPLIISVLAGVVTVALRGAFQHFDISFRLSDIKPIYTVLGYLSNLATPLALLVLGAQFEFSAVKEMGKEIVFGTVVRTVIVPIIGIGAAFILFRDIFGGAHFATFVAMFGTPVAVSSVPMAQEMDSDASLAGQLVVWTTVVSGFTVFIASFLLKAAGVF